MTEGRNQASQDEDQRESQRETRIADVADKAVASSATPRSKPCSGSTTCTSTTARSSPCVASPRHRRNQITALIGPSGCGKSTVLRCLNRMNDLIPGARVEGKIVYHGQDLYGDGVDPVEVRRRIGMVFQKPNPFPKSIYDNVAFGPRVIGCSPTAWTTSSSGPCAGPRSGTRSRTS